MGSDHHASQIGFHRTTFGIDTRKLSPSFSFFLCNYFHNHLHLIYSLIRLLAPMPFVIASYETSTGTLLLRCRVDGVSIHRPQAGRITAEPLITPNSIVVYTNIHHATSTIALLPRYTAYSLYSRSLLLRTVSHSIGIFWLSPCHHTRCLHRVAKCFQKLGGFLATAPLGVEPIGCRI